MDTSQMKNMPSLTAVRIYLATSLILAVLAGIIPIAIIFSMLAVCFASVALLSIPRIRYPSVLLILLAEAVIAAGLTLLFTRSAFCCFAAASFAPAAALLILTIRRHNSRTCGIILTAIGMGVFYIACFLVAVYMTYHRLSFSVFRELYESAQSQAVAALSESLPELLADYLSSGLIDEGTLNEMIPEMFRFTVLLLPALIIDAFLILAWLSTVCLRTIFRPYVYGARRFGDWRVTMNRPTAIIFCIASLFMGFTIFFDPSQVLSAVIISIILILLPGFFCEGCSIWKRRLSMPGGRMSCSLFMTPLLLIFFGLLVSPFYPIYFVALSGALRLILPPFKPRMPGSNPGDTPPFTN